MASLTSFWLLRPRRAASRRRRLLTGGRVRPLRRRPSAGRRCRGRSCEERASGALAASSWYPGAAERKRENVAAERSARGANRRGPGLQNFESALASPRPPASGEYREEGSGEGEKERRRKASAAMAAPSAAAAEGGLWAERLERLRQAVDGVYALRDAPPAASSPGQAAAPAAAASRDRRLKQLPAAVTQASQAPRS